MKDESQLSSSTITTVSPTTSARMNPRGILISPGPGAPQDFGISLQTVLELGPIVPLFGVCMGLQCIGEAFGGKVVRSPSGVMHGKSSLVYYDEKQPATPKYQL
nr:anthranilate synthase beta subunit 1, chloroplastic [Quercus suber]